MSGESRAANRFTDQRKDRDWGLDCRYGQIAACLSAFQSYISPLSPLLRPDELTLSNILELLHGNQPAQKAVALAVWALGEWCLNARAGSSIAEQELRVKETDARCSEAADLLERDTAKGLHGIRAHILLAFYSGLRGDLCGFRCYLAKAVWLLKRVLSGESLSGAISSEENSYLVAFWICAGMERYGTCFLSQNLLLTYTVRCASCRYIAEYSRRVCSICYIHRQRGMAWRIVLARPC